MSELKDFLELANSRLLSHNKADDDTESPSPSSPDFAEQYMRQETEPLEEDARRKYDPTLEDRLDVIRAAAPPATEKPSSGDVSRRASVILATITDGIGAIARRLSILPPKEPHSPDDIEANWQESDYADESRRSSQTSRRSQISVPGKPYTITIDPEIELDEVKEVSFQQRETERNAMDDLIENFGRRHENDGSEDDENEVQSSENFHVAQTWVKEQQQIVGRPISFNVQGFFGFPRPLSLQDMDDNDDAEMPLSPTNIRRGKQPAIDRPSSTLDEGQKGPRQSFPSLTSNDRSFDSRPGGSFVSYLSEPVQQSAFARNRNVLYEKQVVAEQNRQRQHYGDPLSSSVPCVDNMGPTNEEARIEDEDLPGERRISSTKHHAPHDPVTKSPVNTHLRVGDIALSPFYDSSYRDYGSSLIPSALSEFQASHRADIDTNFDRRYLHHDDAELQEERLYRNLQPPYINSGISPVSSPLPSKLAALDDYGSSWLGPKSEHDHVQHTARKLEEESKGKRLHSSETAVEHSTTPDGSPGGFSEVTSGSGGLSYSADDTNMNRPRPQEPDDNDDIEAWQDYEQQLQQWSKAKATSTRREETTNNPNTFRSPPDLSLFDHLKDIHASEAPLFPSGCGDLEIDATQSETREHGLQPSSPPPIEPEIPDEAASNKEWDGYGCRQQAYEEELQSWKLRHGLAESKIKRTLSDRQQSQQKPYREGSLSPKFMGLGTIFVGGLQPGLENPLGSSLFNSSNLMGFGQVNNYDAETLYHDTTGHGAPNIELTSEDGGRLKKPGPEPPIDEVPSEYKEYEKNLQALEMTKPVTKDSVSDPSKIDVVNLYQDELVIDQNNARFLQAPADKKRSPGQKFNPRLELEKSDNELREKSYYLDRVRVKHSHEIMLLKQRRSSLERADVEHMQLKVVDQERNIIRLEEKVDQLKHLDGQLKTQLMLNERLQIQLGDTRWELRAMEQQRNRWALRVVDVDHPVDIADQADISPISSENATFEQRIIGNLQQTLKEARIIETSLRNRVDGLEKENEQLFIGYREQQNELEEQSRKILEERGMHLDLQERFNNLDAENDYRILREHELMKTKQSLDDHIQKTNESLSAELKKTNEYLVDSRERNDRYIKLVNRLREELETLHNERDEDAIHAASRPSSISSATTNSSSDTSWTSVFTDWTQYQVSRKLKLELVLWHAEHGIPEFDESDQSVLSETEDDLSMVKRFDRRVPLLHKFIQLDSAVNAIDVRVQKVNGNLADQLDGLLSESE